MRTADSSEAPGRAVANYARSTVLFCAAIGCQSQLELDDYTFSVEGAEQGGGGGAPTGASDRITDGMGGARPAGGAAGGVMGNEGPGGGSGNGGSGSSDMGGSGSDMGGSNDGATGGTDMNGSGGSGDTAPEPVPAAPPAADCLPQDDVLVIHTDRTNGSDASNVLSMVLGVQNFGPTFELTDLTLRYWFARDGLLSFTADVDYATQTSGVILTDAISVSFGEERGSSYAEIGFSSGDPVGPEGVQQVQLRVHTNVYDVLDQVNDFSYAAGAASMPNRNITPYVAGMQVGGCVPVP